MQALSGGGSRWALRDSNSSGGIDYGGASGFDIPHQGTYIAGDWNGDKSDTPGVVTAGGTWVIKNSNDASPQNGTFQYGFSGATPLLW